MSASDSYSLAGGMTSGKKAAILGGGLLAVGIGIALVLGHEEGEGVFSALKTAGGKGSLGAKIGPVSLGPLAGTTQRFVFEIKTEPDGYSETHKYRDIWLGKDGKYADIGGGQYLTLRPQGIGH